MFIVIEGSDGSGKTTQFKLLAERLRAAGHEVDVYDFPRYDEPSSYFVQHYLNGEYGPASELSPYTASLFYALDRFEAAPLIRQSLADAKIVLANRYTGSNMAHQGAKFGKPAEQRGFFVWADSLEFQLLGIPRPTINLFLRVPADMAFELIKKKAARSYTNQMHDEHEADIEHLHLSVSTYDSLCRLFPKDFKAIDCALNNKILSVTDINNSIWEVLKPLLPKPSHPGHSKTVNLISDAKKISSRPKIDEGPTDDLELKDVSLLSLNSLLGQGFAIDYQLKWPPANEKARLTYFIPAEFSPKLAKKYHSTMDKLATFGKRVNKSLDVPNQKYASHIAPLATLVDAKISGNPLTLKQLLSKASATSLTELLQVTKQTGAQLKEPQALKQIIRQMAASRLGANSAAPGQGVKLLSATPRNELDLLADCLYPYSNLSRDEIAAEVDGWTYQQKANALKVFCESETRAVLKKIQYRFEITEDTLTLASLAQSLLGADAQFQAPSPRYGYRVPAAIEEAALDEGFIECFDLSLELYSDIQAAGLDYLAAYTVLAGHLQRWQFTLDGEGFFGWLANEPGSKVIFEPLIEQIAEVHPLITESVKKSLTNERWSQPKQQQARKAPEARRPTKKRRSQSKK